jgi:hypothetical protein
MLMHPEPEITAGGFPTKFRFFRPNAEMIGNFVRANFEKKKNVFLMIGSAFSTVSTICKFGLSTLG